MAAPDDEEEPIVKTLKRTCLSWIPAMLASSAFVCGMLFNFWCESVQFKTTNNASSTIDSDSYYSDLHFGPWYQLKVSIDSVETGGGYQKIYTTKQCVDWEYDPDPDSKWKTTKAFTIIAAILGGFLAFFLWFVPCSAGRITPGLWRGLALTSGVILTLFQGLTFLFFRSVACTDNVVVQSLERSNNLYDDQCSWDSGSTANVISVVCWLLTGLFMGFMGLPKGPEPRPIQTQDVHYELETPPDGTQVPVQTRVVKGTAVQPY